jgi:hypothetical protein
MSIEHMMMRTIMRENMRDPDSAWSRRVRRDARRRKVMRRFVRRISDNRLHSLCFKADIYKHLGSNTKTNFLLYRYIWIIEEEIWERENKHFPIDENSPLTEEEIPF